MLFKKQDKQPESPQFPTVDVAYAMDIVSARRGKGRKRKSILPPDDEDC